MAVYVWQLGRRDEALRLSAEGIAFLSKLSAENPEVPLYGTALANAISARGQYLQELGRIDEAVSSGRQAAEILETKPDPDASALATAAFYRGRVAGLLAGDSAAREFKSWPEAARREADLAVADLRAAVARGFRRADLIHGDVPFKSLMARDDVKALLAEMERPSAEPAPGRRRRPRPPRVRPRRWTGRTGSRKTDSWASWPSACSPRTTGRPIGRACAWKRCWIGSRRGGSRAQVRPAWSRSRKRSA